MAGLVSFFSRESGEITYLPNVPIFVSAAPLDSGYNYRTKQLSAVETKAAMARNQARLRALAGNGQLVTTIMTDRFGRFRATHLPDGHYYAIAITREEGQYLVWQGDVDLRGGRTERLYFNRNNLSVLGKL